MPDASDLIVQTARRDVEEGLVRALEIVRARHSRPMAATLEAIVNTAVTTLHVLDRVEPEVRFVIEYARRLNAGEDVRALVQEALPELLKRKKVNLIVREKDPAYHMLEHAFLAAFERRLPDLARMIAVQDPVDYDDLVRKAFPDRDHVDRIVAEQAAFVHGAIDHIEKNPHLLRVPNGLVAKLAESAREMANWQVAKVRRGVTEIYGERDPRKPGEA